MSIAGGHWPSRQKELARVREIARQTRVMGKISNVIGPGRSIAPTFMVVVRKRVKKVDVFGALYRTASSETHEICCPARRGYPSRWQTRRRFTIAAMAMPTRLREDFDDSRLRALAKRTRNAGQLRRALARTEVHDGRSRGAAPRLGGVGQQTVRDWASRCAGGTQNRPHRIFT